MTVSAEQIKKLRELTGAGVLESKRILEQQNGNFDQALDILKAKGLAAAAKKSERTARAGLIESYIHAGGKAGVLLELNCETDFVARTDAFKQLAHDLALQIVATNPKYVGSSEIPAATVTETRQIFENQARAEGKRDDMIDRIVTGKLDKYYQQVCLLQQPFVKDESTSIYALIQSVIARVGENIVVRRFARYELGEGE